MRRFAFSLALILALASGCSDEPAEPISLSQPTVEYSGTFVVQYALIGEDCSSPIFPSPRSVTISIVDGAFKLQDVGKVLDPAVGAWDPSAHEGDGAAPEMTILYTDYGWYSCNYSVSVKFESGNRFRGTMHWRYEETPGGGGACSAAFSMIGQRK
jgi:hypothetical protein